MPIAYKVTPEMKEQMRQMKAAGMGVTDIAKAMELSPTTVSYHVGKSGARKMSRHAYDPEPIKKKAEPVVDTYTPSLVVQNRTFVLHGMLGEYNIDCKAGEVLATIQKENNNEELFLMRLKAKKPLPEGVMENVPTKETDLKTIDDYINAAQTFANELQAIKRRMEDLKLHNEMW